MCKCLSGFHILVSSNSPGTFFSQLPPPSVVGGVAALRFCGQLGMAVMGISGEIETPVGIEN